MTPDKENRPAIEVRGVAKRFGDVQAVAGIDFDVREGELFELETRVVQDGEVR